MSQKEKDLEILEKEAELDDENLDEVAGGKAVFDDKDKPQLY